MNRFLVFFFCLFVTSGVSAQAPIPELTSPVIDTTDTLSPDQVKILAHHSFELQREKGSQLQILIVPSTQPEDIAQFAQRVFDKWQLGRAKIDDGVLLIVTLNDRRVRIHTGYGIESLVPDIVANRIITEKIIPHFKNGNYAEGVISGATALEKIIRNGSPHLSEQSGSQMGVIWFFSSIFLGYSPLIVSIFLVGFFVLRIAHQDRKSQDDMAEVISEEIISEAKKDMPKTLAVNTAVLSDTVKEIEIKAQPSKQPSKQPNNNGMTIKEAFYSSLITTEIFFIIIFISFDLNEHFTDSFHIIAGILLFIFIISFIMFFLGVPASSSSDSSSFDSSDFFRSDSSSHSSWSGGGGRSGGGGASGRW